MPRQAKRPIVGPTTPRQFRLRAETLADLDAIAAHLEQESGHRHSRADAIRFAARQAARRLEKNSGNSATSA